MSPLLMMMMVVLFSPDNMFEFVTKPLFMAWYMLVGVDPLDPDLQDESEPESMEVGAEGYCGEVVEGGEEETNFDPDELVDEEEEEEEEGDIIFAPGQNQLSDFW